MKANKSKTVTGKIHGSVGFSQTSGTVRTLTAKEKRQQRRNLKTGNIAGK